MELLDAIESQMIANRLPLVGVSIAAVPHANTPVVLTLHWHGFIEHTLAPESTETVRYEPVPSSSLQINQRWDTFEDLDYAALEVAWELGAWDLARTEARPVHRPGSETSESVACMNVFGLPPIAIDGQPLTVAEVPDGEDLIECAGRSGYLNWLFRPVRGGLWEVPPDDLTLEPGGYRNPTCPELSKPMADTRWITKPRKVVYQLGRSERIPLLRH